MIRTNAGIDDHRPTLTLPAGHSNDVSRLQDRQRLQCLRSAVRAPLPGGSRLKISDLRPEAGVRPKIAELTLSGRPVVLDRLLIPGQGARRTNHRAVGLKLREGLLEQST